VPFHSLQEVYGLSEEEKAYLEYELSDGQRVMLAFHNIDDRDGCHISLDMYKVQLGPITDEVLNRILLKFKGWVLSPDNE
jgi:hypothetical protein